MKRVTTIENLQDMISLGKEIYKANWDMAETGERIFRKEFALWYPRPKPVNLSEHKDYIYQMLEIKCLFWYEPILIN